MPSGQRPRLERPHFLLTPSLSAHQEGPEKSEPFSQRTFSQHNPMGTRAREKGGVHVTKIPGRGTRGATLPKEEERWCHISRWHGIARVEKCGMSHPFHGNPRYRPYQQLRYLGWSHTLLTRSYILSWTNHDDFNQSCLFDALHNANSKSLMQQKRRCAPRGNAFKVTDSSRVEKKAAYEIVGRITLAGPAALPTLIRKMLFCFPQNFTADLVIATWNWGTMFNSEHWAFSEIICAPPKITLILLNKGVQFIEVGIW